MAVVPRKNKGQVVYRVAVFYQDKQYWENAGTDRRAADRLDARRKKEVAEGRYIPPRARSGGITIKAYAERFFDARTNRNAESERTQVERHALALDWFADMRVEDARPPHFLRLVKELRAKMKLVDGVEKRVLGEKSVANILGTIRTMFGDAHFNEVISGNPCVLPRKTLKRRSRSRAPYNGREVLALLSDRVHMPRRVFLWLAFYTGMREGEICGRRWRDWVRDSAPLGALLCTSQYNDQPLKGDDADSGDTRPRVIPVHPELAAVLDDWWSSGWEIVYGRPPTDDDFIVPNRFNPERSQSRSSAYKQWRKACEETGVANHSLHSTRHTFTTFARRGTPRTDAVEAITHNKRGEMVDYYNHWLWTPICEAMASLSYQADAHEHHPLSLVKARSGGPSGSSPLGAGASGSGTPPTGVASASSSAVAAPPGDVEPALGTPPGAQTGAAKFEGPGVVSSSRTASDAPADPEPALVDDAGDRETHRAIMASCAPLKAAGGWENVGLASEKLPNTLPGSSKYLKSLWRRRELKRTRAHPRIRSSLKTARSGFEQFRPMRQIVHLSARSIVAK